MDAEENVICIVPSCSEVCRKMKNSETTNEHGFVDNAHLFEMHEVANIKHFAIMQWKFVGRWKIQTRQNGLDFVDNAHCFKILHIVC